MTAPARIAHNPSILSVALLGAVFVARAATLGEIEVQSRPGEPLVATIPITVGAGERMEPACVFLSRGSPELGTYITGAKVALETLGPSRMLHLRSNEPVVDPKALLRVVLRCSGDSAFAYREYGSLFTRAPALAPIAPPIAAAPPAPAKSAPAPAPAPTPSEPPSLPPAPSTPASLGFPVQPGDTFESIARLIFPREAQARRVYLQALRESNPHLASHDDRDPLPAGSTLVLPDLRTFARGRTLEPQAAEPAIAAAPPIAAPQKTPAPRKAAPARSAPPVPPPVPRAPKAAAAEPPARTEAPPAKAPAPRAASAPASAFVLKLSSQEVDLSRTRGIDDRTRARIRERQRMLDADDQVAAFLALRDTVQRLEGRVAELQLKLSTLATTPPPRAAAPPPEPPKVEPPKVAAAPKPEPPKAEPPKVELPKVEPPKVEPPKVEPPKVEPPKVELPKPEPPKAVEARVEPPKVDAPAPPKPAATTARPAKAAASDASESSLPVWLWGAIGALALVALWLAWRWFARRGEEVEEPEEAIAGPSSEELPLPEEPVAEDQSLEHFELDPDAPVDVAAPPRREIDSDVELSTRVNAGDPTALRQRYIEERFPEIVNGTIVLDDPDSVVKAARLFYQDGAIPRAVELLQYATGEKPAQVKPWLALFEIYRLERLSGEFAELARRFKEPHGRGETWRKVQYFGREVDPANPLYRDIDSGIETIRFEAGKPPPLAAYDPIAENWLDAPMDFENEVLASDLRRTLMNSAGLNDEDLVPNPMPALRSVEMFTVA